MRYVAMISAPRGPAHFPDKLLVKLNGKSVIQYTYDSVKSSGLFEDVIVVTDVDKVVELITGLGGKVLTVKGSIDNCLEKTAEVSIGVDGDVFVCIPGDHLRLHKPAIEKLFQQFEGVYGKDIKVASIVQKVQEASRIADVNTVKVALSLRMYALYFSRGVIPLVKNPTAGFSHFAHVNIVACRKESLLNLLQQPLSPLERAEQIDCLRFVENGVPVKMIMEQYPTADINTAADVPAAEAFVSNQTEN